MSIKFREEVVTSDDNPEQTYGGNPSRTHEKAARGKRERGSSWTSCVDKRSAFFTRGRGES